MDNRSSKPPPMTSHLFAPPAPTPTAGYGASHILAAIRVRRSRGLVRRGSGRQRGAVTR